MEKIEGFSNRRELVRCLESVRDRTNSNDLVRVILDDQEKVLLIYPASIRKFSRGGVFMAGKYNDRNALFIIGRESLRVMQEYDGNIIHRQSDFVVMKCRWIRSVAQKIREDFPYCAPKNEQNGQASIAFGDVLGMAGKAQLLAFKGKANLAFSRQCIHQLRRLDMHPEDARDVVTWTIFSEGFEGGFAAEACHLTTPEDLKVMLDAGYTRFSIEPFIEPLYSIREKPKKELLEAIFEIPWIDLDDKFELMFHRYKGNRIDLGPIYFSDEGEQPESRVIMPNEAEVLAAIRMLGEIIIQVVEMERVLVMEGRRDDVILEISFARTKGSLTPFELFFLVTELLRRDVQPDFIAPGEEITQEHWLVARQTRITGLSGPVDKLTDVPDQTTGLRFYGVVKDISYLTALECIAAEEPVLFRKVWDQSRNVLEKVKEEFALNLNIQKFPSEKEYTDEDLPKLLQLEHAERFLKYTMSEVFAKKDEQGRRFLRLAVYDFIRKYESDYTDALVKHYRHSMAAA